jgi:hypothetical protein
VKGTGFVHVALAPEAVEALRMSTPVPGSKIWSEPVAPLVPERRHAPFT